MEQIKSSADIAHYLKLIESKTRNDLRGRQEAVEKVISHWPNNRGLYTQLQKLAEFISKTRAELALLRPNEMKQQFIPKATDELDAIVEATASATHRIMDAADLIMTCAESAPDDVSAKINSAVTSIFEACTFQDITGQRVTKIVSMLKVIETRIDKMVEAVGEGEVVAGVEKQAEEEPVSSSSQDEIDALFATGPSATNPDGTKGSTLHGPALPGQGASQDDVDAILKGKG